MGLVANLLINADAVLFNSTGLLFVVLGVFVLIRLAGFPDLTVDGSFTVGAALYSVSLIATGNVFIALFAAAAAGTIGGLLTWSINQLLGVGRVVSGVLSMIVLILSAPYISGGSTKSLLHVHSLFGTLDVRDATLSKALIGNAPYQAHFIFTALWLFAFCVTAVVLLVVCRSPSGLRLRYIGSAPSPTLVPRREQRVLLLMGLMSGNALVAIGGAVEAHRRGGFTNNMGTGIILVGLAVLVLGEALLKSLARREYLHLHEFALSIVLGCILYSAGIQLLLALRIAVVDLRLLTALFLILLLGIAGRAHSSSTTLF